MWYNSKEFKRRFAVPLRAGGRENFGSLFGLAGVYEGGVSYERGAPVHGGHLAVDPYQMHSPLRSFKRTFLTGVGGVEQEGILVWEIERLSASSRPATNTSSKFHVVLCVSFQPHVPVMSWSWR